MQRRTFLQSLAASGLPALAVAEPVQRQMKISAVETYLLHFSPGRAYYDSIHAFGGERGAVALRIRTDAGITGWGYSSFGMNPGGPAVVQQIIEKECRPALVGKDPTLVKKLRA